MEHPLPFLINIIQAETSPGGVQASKYQLSIQKPPAGLAWPGFKVDQVFWFHGATGLSSEYREGENLELRAPVFEIFSIY